MEKFLLKDLGALVKTTATKLIFFKAQIPLEFFIYKH